jgi:hypothetical protein
MPRGFRVPLPSAKQSPPGGVLGHTASIVFHTFLGLLAKIKCSICSYQFNR